MVQHFAPKGKEPKNSAAITVTSDDASSLPSQALQLDQDNNAISSALLGRYRGLLVEAQKILPEVDFHDWLKAVAGATTRIISGPRAGPYTVSNLSQTQLRKRLIPRCPSCQCAKRQKLSQDDATTDVDEGLAPDPDDGSDDSLDDDTAFELHSAEVADLGQFFIDAFKSLGQLACKDILKAWLRRCHPNKQTKFPYNGGSSWRKSLREHGFKGAFTKPSYWPSWEGWRDGLGCRHLEPDHLWKKERLICLTHLLCSNDPSFSLDKLRIATAKIEHDVPKNFTARSTKTLKQIYRARAKQIQYQNKEINANTLVSVSMPKPSTKARKASKSVVSLPIKREPSQQNPPKQATSRLPVANMGTERRSMDETLIIARKRNNTQEYIKVNLASSSPASAVSSIASNGVNVASTGNDSRISRSATPIRPFAPIETSKRELGQGLGSMTSYSQRDFSPVPITDRNNCQSLQRQAHKSRKEASNKGAGADPARCSRNLEPYLGGGSAHYISSSRIHDSLAGSSGKRVDRQTRVPRQCLQDRIVPSTSGSLVSLACQPGTPKPMTFAGSASGLAGLSPDNAWPIADDLLTAQQYHTSGTPLPGDAGPEAVFPSYISNVHPAFGSDFTNTNNSAGSGLLSATWSEPMQTYPSRDQRALEAQYQQQYRTYLPSSLTTMSVDAECQGGSALFQSSFQSEGGSKFPPLGQSFGQVQW